MESFPFDAQLIGVLAEEKIVTARGLRRVIGIDNICGCGGGRVQQKHLFMAAQIDGGRTRTGGG